MNKLDITTIILTYNEEIHIQRCLENVCQFSKRVIVVDSPSTDRTQEIIKSLSPIPSPLGEGDHSGMTEDGCRIDLVVHKYPGNQAEQFNWALDNIKIDTEWILRIDADEYLLPDLVEELQQKLPTLPKDVTGVEFKRRHIFMGKWVKHGIYPIIILRTFRTGKARYDNRLMDEHIALTEGHSVVFDNDFCDHSLISLDDYCKKHMNYASREAVEILINENEDENENKNKKKNILGAQAEEKHRKKSGYNKLPLFWRSFAYFVYRYIVRLGFLDGKEGFLFAFIQGWWYRTLVDAKVYECKKACGNDKEKIREFIKSKWGISVD